MLNIKRYIFWVDKNIKNNENQKYLKRLNKEFPFYIKETFESIENLENFLTQNKKDYDFKFIYMIISGSLAEEFFNRYNLFTLTTIVAATVVFCKNKSYHSSKHYANDLYLNPGGVVNNFNEVIQYIKNSNDILWLNLTSIKENSIILPKKNIGFGNTFKYAQSLSEIALPIILTEIIKKNLIQDLDILKFKKYIFSKYINNEKNNIIIPLTKPSLEKSVYIPLKKRAKFLIRLYTTETDFYRDINKELTNIDGFGPYKVFILILYFSIQNKSLNSYVKDKLYRRTLISKGEMDEIIKIFEFKKNNSQSKNEISSILYYAKPFMSFSKERSVTLKFAKIIYPNTVRVMFILNPSKYKDKIYFSNIDIDELNVSKYNEKEVLFLPLSCFEIVNYKQIGDNDYEITLNYLDKYYDKLNKRISSMKKQKEVQDFYEKVLESPFSEEAIECFEDYHNTFSNIKDYFLERSTVQNINLHFNKIIPKLSKRVSSGFRKPNRLKYFIPSEPLKFKEFKMKELNYADENKALIENYFKEDNNMIIKRIYENVPSVYYNEPIKSVSEEIKIGGEYTRDYLEFLDNSNKAETQESLLLRNGFGSANLLGGAIGYNLANIDNFIKLSGKDKVKTIGATLGLSTGIITLSNTAKSAVPVVYYL